MQTLYRQTISHLLVFQNLWDQLINVFLINVYHLNYNIKQIIDFQITVDVFVGVCEFHLCLVSGIETVSLLWSGDEAKVMS